MGGTILWFAPIKGLNILWLQAGLFHYWINVCVPLHLTWTDRAHISSESASLKHQPLCYGIGGKSNFPRRRISLVEEAMLLIITSHFHHFLVKAFSSSIGFRWLFLSYNYNLAFKLREILKEVISDHREQWSYLFKFTSVSVVLKKNNKKSTSNNSLKVLVWVLCKEVLLQNNGGAGWWSVHTQPSHFYL